MSEPLGPWHSRVHPALLYSAGRLIVFGLALGVFALLTFRGWALIILALIVSMPLSALLLRGPRRAWAARVEQSVSGRRDRRDRLRAQLRGDLPPDPPLEDRR